MFKKKKSGFTIVELMVVMAIMAVMSSLGILAMVGINNQMMADKIAENLLSEIREIQNKSLSVASVDTSGGTKSYPLAWGIKIVANNFSKFYISDNIGYSENDITDNLSNADLPNYSISVKGSDGATYEATSFIYTAPFGKYFAVSRSNICSGINGDSLCSKDVSRPYSLLVASSNENITNVVSITITYRGVVRVINISTNGEAKITNG